MKGKYLWFAAISAMSAHFQANAQLASNEEDTSQTEPSIIEKRIASEKKAINDPFVITQMRPNYILPYTYIDNPNQLGSSESNEGNIEHNEAKYQLSVKMPLYNPGSDSLEGLYFGFTAVSYWQVYNSEISKPFRETNYEPEVYYTWQQNLRILGVKFNFVQLGLNHQSNGQSGDRSRSWNRAYVNFLFTDNDDLYGLKVWYRFKEDPKDEPTDPVGDDNPDITHYLGHFEFIHAAKFGDWQLATSWRNNLNLHDNKGSVELNLTYPLSEKYELLFQYFNGYGDSLIDYNRQQQRVGLGIQLSFL